MTPRKTDNPQNQVLYVRVDEALLQRLDRHAKRMAKAMPGMNPTRSDAIRSLLHQALDIHEKEDPE